MTIQRVLTIALLIATACCLSITSARADDGACAYGHGFGYGMGYLYNSLDYRVPYFAAHPPVYYSYPVPRTYGYSPFAYPPYVETPQVVEEVEPVQVINPYVPQAEGDASAPVDRSTAVRRTPDPLIVINPYVASDASIARADR